MFTIKKACHEINSIYAHRNESLSFEYIYSYLTRKISFLSREFIRGSDDDRSKLKHTYIDALSWLIAISEKMDIDLEDAFIRKFPGVCPYCVKSPCQCSQTHRKPEFSENLKRIKDELESNYNYTYLTPQKKIRVYTPRMINEIYPANRNVFNTFGGFYLSSRLFEELGELHQAYSKYKSDERYPKKNISEELADVTAWMLSLWDIVFKEIDLGDEISNYYVDGCPSCHTKKCVCENYRGRFLLTDKKIELLSSIKELIVNEIQNNPNSDPNGKLELVTRSIDLAITSRVDTDERLTINELNTAIQSAQSESSGALYLSISRVMKELSSDAEI